MVTKMKPTIHKIPAKRQQELITQAEYARRKCVSRTTICKHVRYGKITLVDGKINSVMADKQLKANLDVSQMRKVKLSDNDVGDELNKYQKARTKREYYNAKLAELEYQEKAGLLILVKDV